MNDTEAVIEGLDHAAFDDNKTKRKISSSLKRKVSNIRSKQNITLCSWFENPFQMNLSMQKISVIETL